MPAKRIASSGDLSSRLLNELLSRNCWHDEDGREGTFHVQLCCLNLEVKVHATKVAMHYRESGEYDYTEYKVSMYSIREME